MCFGNFGVSLKQPCCISAKELTLLLRYLKKLLKSIDKKIKIRLRIFPGIPLTRKPRDIRMGRGKGQIVEYVCYVSPGSILFELINLRDKFTAFEIFQKCKNKLGVSCVPVYRYNYD